MTEIATGIMTGPALAAAGAAPAPLAAPAQAQTADDMTADKATELLPPSFLRRAAPVNTEYLAIVWAPELAATETRDAKKAKELRQKACVALGQSFLAGRGLWGMGIFTSYGCYLPKATSRFAGAAPATGQPVAWELTLTWHGRHLELALAYKPKKLQVASVSIPASRWSLDLFRDPLYAKLVAAQLLDGMPAAFRFPDTHSSAAQPSAGVNAFNDAQPEAGRPVKLTTFTLQITPGGLWLPALVGEASLGKRIGTSLGWQLASAKGALSSSTGQVYGQRSSGLHQAEDELSRLLSERQEALLRDPAAPGYRELRVGMAKDPRFVFLDNVASGYVGFRYGYEQRAAGTAVLPPLVSLGLIAELRTGLLEGLRVYYDLVPRRSSVFDGNQLYLGWQRFVVGYGFGFDLPFFINRIEIAPKVGLWTVNSRLPYIDGQGNTQYTDFNMPLAPSFGAEACAEIETSNYLLRGWYAKDYSSVLISKSPIKREVNSSRYGVDAVLKGPTLGFIGKNWHLGFLLFYFEEDEYFASTAPNSTAFSLEDSTAFAGGGLSVSW